tara:strand:+ start:1141 stop:4014 length:2874 start_codon:yes stop_codon:yes gene_type:complete
MGPILKETVIKPAIKATVDVTKPLVKKILQESKEILGKGASKKSIRDTLTVAPKPPTTVVPKPDVEGAVKDTTEGAAQAEAGSLSSETGALPKPNKINIKPESDANVEELFELIKPQSKSKLKNTKNLESFNIKYINSDQDILDLIALQEKQHSSKIAEIRKVGLKDEAVQEIADAYGKDTNKLTFDFLSTKPGEVPPPAKIRAFRDFYLYKTEQLDLLAQKAVNGTDADRIMFKQEMALVANLQQKLTGIRSDAGRALREWQLTSQATRFSDSSFAELNMATTLEKMGGAEDIAQTAKMFLQLPKNKRGKFVDNAGFGRKLTDAAYESFINLILSNPVTHFKNIAGNTTTLYMSNFERSYAAKFNQIMGKTDGVAHFEGYAKSFGMQNAYSEALEQFFKAINGEQTLVAGSKVEAPASVFNASEFGVKNQIMAKGVDVIGKVMTLNGLPLKSLNAGDVFYKTLAYRSEINALAYREAFRLMKAGELDEKKAGAWIADFVTHPTKEAQEAAFKEAQYITFQTPKGQKGDLLSQGAKGINEIRKLPLGRYFITFLQTPTNILRYSAERTPGLNLLTDWGTQFKKGGASKDLAMAKLSIGSMFIMSGGSLGYFGLATGTNATIENVDANKKIQSKPYALEKALDIPSNSLIIGDTVLSFNGIDPFGQMLSQSIDIMQLGREIWEHGGDKEAWTKAATALAISIGENFLNKSYTKQSKEYFKILSGDKDFINNLKKSGKKIFESAATPGFVRQINRWGDMIEGDTGQPVSTNALEVGSMINNIKANTPGMSADVPKDFDIFGNEKHQYRLIRKKRDIDMSEGLYTELSTTMPNIREIKKYLVLDPLKMAVIKAKTTKNKGLQKQLSNLPRGRITVDLNHEELSNYRRVAGKMVLAGLEQFIKTNSYKKAPNDYFKKTLILDQVSDIRSKVFEELLIKGFFNRALNIAQEKFRNEMIGYNQ